MTTIREQIIASISTRLAEIRTANGYRTECGASVHLARAKIDPAECPAAVLWPRTEEVERSYGGNLCTMPIEVEAFSLHGDVSPVTVSESMLADLIECLTGNIWTLTFTTGSIEVEVGATITGATSAAMGYVTAVSVTSGSWAGGDAAGTLTLRRVTGEFQAENLKVNTIVVAAGTGITGQSAVSAMGGLAEEITYTRGGTDAYPQPGETSTGTTAEFDVKYKTLTGDPYHQPS